MCFNAVPTKKDVSAATHKSGRFPMALADFRSSNSPSDEKIKTSLDT